MNDYIEELVSEFETVHVWGFTSDEVDAIFNIVYAQYLDMNIRKAYRSLTYDSCMIVNGDEVRYRQDVSKALRMSFEK